MSLKISAKSEYACLAVLALAQRGRESPPVRIREISKAYAIPERYLVQILLQLKGAGLVSSTRGALGGYRLARKATAISLSEILNAIDAPETSAPDARNAKPGLSRLSWLGLGRRTCRGAGCARSDDDCSACGAVLGPRMGYLSAVAGLDGTSSWRDHEMMFRLGARPRFM